MKKLSRLFGAFGRLSVAAQLYASFGLLAALLAVVAGVGMLGLARVNGQAAALEAKWLRGSGLMSEARAALVETREFEVKHSRTDDKSYHSEYEDKIKATSVAFAKALKGYESLLVSDEERKSFAALQKATDDYEKAAGKVLAAGKAGKKADAADFSDGLAATAYDDSIASAERLIKYNFDGGAGAAQRAHQVYQSAMALAASLTAAALVAALAAGLVITRRLQRQLGGEPAVAAAVAAAVAEGDLTTPIVLRRGDTDSLMARLARMQRGLADAVGKVRLGAESVATASAQIAQGNQDLSGRTEQQASALQQTAATMEQLGTTVRHNADNARQANQLAQGASSVAIKGGGVVGEVVSTMKDINDSSRRISDIIAVIDGIAFQTNILALNAAVEAARAGEQGRGFAVVAGEVRSLAQRSAEAAREIKSLIGASVERVEKGSVLVDEAGRTMQDIVGAIRRVTDVVGEISSASTEQSSGVAQVSEAVSGMDRSTQQNAALVEQSAAAAESLRQQAQQLLDAVAVFRLDGTAPALR
jgi:methyl-accepting chemotaxis protein